MNKEALEQRLVALRGQLAQVEANGNAIAGAMQECEFWLKRLDTVPQDHA